MAIDVEGNREAQRVAYGEPLHAIFDRIKHSLGLSQVALSQILGLSAPMLSHLNSGQRVKIGNPLVLGRVQQLNDLAERVRTSGLTAQQVEEKIAEIQDSQGSLVHTTQVVKAQVADAEIVAGMRNILRAVSSGTGLRAAAEKLAPEHPELAEVLRIYGTGALAPAEQHFMRYKEDF